MRERSAFDRWFRRSGRGSIGVNPIDIESIPASIGVYAIAIELLLASIGFYTIAIALILTFIGVSAINVGVAPIAMGNDQIYLEIC